MHQTCAFDSLNLPGTQHINKVCLERHLTEGEVAEVGEPPAVSNNNGGDGITLTGSVGQRGSCGRKVPRLPTSIDACKVFGSGATINGPRYVLTLRRLRRAIQQKRQKGKWASGVLLQHDNARPHTSAYTTSNIASLGFQTIPHPPYSPDLAPSDYHLFGAMKKPLLKGKQFADQTALQQAVRTWRHSVPQQWYQDGLRRLPKQSWEKCIAVKWGYVEKGVA